MKLTISLGQMDVQLGEPAKNVAWVRKMATESAQRGTDVLVLPELWSTGYDLENVAIHATQLNEGIFQETAVIAETYQLHIIGSCLSQLDNERYGNTLTWFDPNGRLIAKYDKIHLFRLMDEHKYLTAGGELGEVKIGDGSSSSTVKAGLAICYDLRFPELFRSYALAGAQFVVLPAEWPHPRLFHWQTLIRARAIENQMFVIACNRVGISKETRFAGHSCIIDPWGDVVVEGRESEGLLTAVVDLSEVEKTRSKIPIFDDRQPKVYKTK